MNVYKIQNRNNCLFSSGGNWLKATSKCGKIWSRIGHVKSHIKMLIPGIPSYNDHKKLMETYLKDCDVVEYELVEKRRRPAVNFYVDGGF